MPILETETVCICADCGNIGPGMPSYRNVPSRRDVMTCLNCFHVGCIQTFTERYMPRKEPIN